MYPAGELAVLRQLLFIYIMHVNVLINNILIVVGVRILYFYTAVREFENYTPQPLYNTIVGVHSINCVNS